MMRLPLFQRLDLERKSKLKTDEKNCHINFLSTSLAFDVRTIQNFNSKFWRFFRNVGYGFYTEDDRKRRL